MSRTRRADLGKVRGGKSVWMRKPRGHKQALQTGARAVPPSAWEDVNVGAEAVRQAQRARRGSSRTSGFRPSGGPSSERLGQAGYCR